MVAGSERTTAPDMLPTGVAFVLILRNSKSNHLGAHLSGAEDEVVAGVGEDNSGHASHGCRLGPVLELLLHHSRAEGSQVAALQQEKNNENGINRPTASRTQGALYKKGTHTE